ncbi:phosphatidylethanolamine-binding protein [Flammula alnicola]|nr:phosphatidylethanolamine-binding protein [Flammula alnicola]
MLSSIFFVSLLLGCASAQTAALSNVTTAFPSAKIVPDVIDSFTPNSLVNVTFTDSTTGQKADVIPGALLTMEQTAAEPALFFEGVGSSASTSGTFVVVIVDPDALTPQNPNEREFLHFTGGNFTVDSSTGALSNSTPALIEFFPPTPPAGSDPHRYVVLVFTQPADFSSTAPSLVNDSTPRPSFDLPNFLQATDLGTVLAGNYFLVGPSSNSSASPTAASSAISPSASAPASDGISISMNLVTHRIALGIAILATFAVYSL